MQDEIIAAIAAYLQNKMFPHYAAATTNMVGCPSCQDFCQSIAEEIAAAIAPHLEAGEPDWKDAPDWANYIAMDANGYWWWYSEKPQLSRGIWAFGGERMRKSLYKQDVAWYESLQERPK